jgi:hypothetical protein
MAKINRIAKKNREFALCGLACATRRECKPDTQVTTMLQQLDSTAGVTYNGTSQACERKLPI